MNLHWLAISGRSRYILPISRRLMSLGGMLKSTSPLRPAIEMSCWYSPPSMPDIRELPEPSRLDTAKSLRTPSDLLRKSILGIITSRVEDTLISRLSLADFRLMVILLNWFIVSTVAL